MANEFRIKNGLIVSGSATVTGIVLDGNTITGVDDSGEFTDNDAHIMTSAGINDKFSVIAGSTSIVTLGTITTGVWNGTAIATGYIADNAVTLAKMAGITRGSIIVGDASGDPAALAIGSNEYVLTSDGTDIAWAEAGGGSGATALNGLTDVISNITNFGDSILISPDGAAPPHGTLSSATNNVGIGKDVMAAMTNALSSVAIGTNALKAITSGDRNIAIGHGAADNFDTENDNIAIGFDALGGTGTGEKNIAIGNYSMDANITGDNSVAIGYAAGGGMTSAHSCVLIGHSAGLALTTGVRNVAIGFEALKTSTTSGDNVAIGEDSLTILSTGSTANVAVGRRSGYRITANATDNVFVGGYEAGGNIASGDANVLVGSFAGQNLNAASSGNVALGYGAASGGSANAASNNVAIGYDSLGALTTGGKNIAVGYQSGDNITSGANNVVIGKADVASATGDDQLSISSGDGGVTWLTGTSAGVLAIQANLDTNSHNIAIDDAHGILDENGNEQLMFQTVGSATAYLQVWNGIADANNGTLFGADVVGSNDTAGTGRMTGPGLEAIGSTTDVGMSFKTKGLGHFSFVQDDTTANAGPVINLVRYVDDDQIADDDVLGAFNFKGGDSTMASPFLHDLRDYAKIKCNLVDVTNGTADGNLIFSALVADAQTEYLEIGTNKTNDTSAGVRAFTGSMVTVSGTGTTALSRVTHAGAYVRATGAGTFTLWDGPKIGDQVVVISDHGGTTTIDGHSSDTINGAANVTITTQYNAKTFIATSASTWIALG